MVQNRLRDQTVGQETEAEPRASAPTRRRRAALATIAVLPTMFTLGNLLCGFSAVFFASRPTDVSLLFGWTPLTIGAVFIFLGMGCDGLDGRIARLTHRTSDLGEQLDSMADMVTFGVAPAFLAVQLVKIQTPFLSAVRDAYFDRTALVIACIYVVCAALRLARFNIELTQAQEDDHLSFKGLPSPGAAGTVASLVLLHQHFLGKHDSTHWLIRAACVGMVAVMLLVALAMVSRVRYTHFINRYVRERATIDYVAMGVIVLLLLTISPMGSLAAGFVLYALSGPATWLWGRTFLRRLQP